MLGLILYCCNLEILNNFLTRGPFSFCIGPWKLHVKYTLLLNLYIQTSCLSRPVYLTARPFHISTWMSNRYLKLSKTKTQLLNFLRQTHSSSSLHISVDNIIMFPLAQAKHLGVTFDSAASLVSHKQSIGLSCWLHLQNIFSIQLFLTTSTAAVLVRAIISLFLDHCNRFP